MRIVQVISHYLPAYTFGGPLQVAHSLGKALSNSGHQVTVVCTNLSTPESCLDVNVDVPINIEGIEVYFEPTLLSSYIGFSPTLYSRLERVIPSADLVIVHAHYQFSQWAGSYLARKYRKPYLIYAHASFHKRGLSHKRGMLKKLYLQLIEKRNVNGALAVVFNSPEEMEASLFREKGIVVASGIDPACFEMCPRGLFVSKYPELADKTRFLFLGRLDIQHKGLDRLLAAFAKVARSREEVQLVLAGPDERNDRGALRHLIQRWGIQDRVVLTGLLTGELKYAAFLESDVFLLPSRFEGTSISLLEALYAGLPVIVTDQVGLCNEIARLECGIVVSEPEELEGAMLRLCDRGARRKFAGRGREMVSREFRWAEISRKLMEAVETTIELRNSRPSPARQ